MTLPLHETLRAEMLHRIEDGRWPEGAVIPSEARLCEEFGVSRGPVRQALAALREAGCLDGPQGRPPSVVTAVPAQATDVFVSFTEWAHALGRTPGQRTREIARRPVDPGVAEQLRVEAGTHVVTLVRQRSLDGAPTMLERTTFTADVGAHLVGADLDSGSVYRRLTEAGVRLTRATHVLDAVAADELDAEMLDVPVGAPLLRERRTTFDETHRPVEYSDDRYRPDRATFVVSNHRASTSRLGLTPVDGAGTPAPAGPTPPRPTTTDPRSHP